MIADCSPCEALKCDFPNSLGLCHLRQHDRKSLKTKDLEHRTAAPRADLNPYLSMGYDDPNIKTLDCKVDEQKKGPKPQKIPGFQLKLRHKNVPVYNFISFFRILPSHFHSNLLSLVVIRGSDRLRTIG